MKNNYAIGMMTAFAMTAGLMAQSGQGQTQMPPQGEPQNMPKITLSGCLQRDTTPPAGGGATGTGGTATGQTGTTTAMYKLTSASVVSGGTGTTGGAMGSTTGSTTGSANTMGGQRGMTATEYRVTAAADSTIDFATHVTHKVELEGMLAGGRRGGMGGGNMGGGNMGGQTGGQRGMGMNAPLFQVTNLKMISSSCQAQ